MILRRHNRRPDGPALAGPEWNSIHVSTPLLPRGRAPTPYTVPIARFEFRPEIADATRWEARSRAGRTAASSRGRDQTSTV